MPSTMFLTKIEEDVLNTLMSECSIKTTQALSEMIGNKVSLVSTSAKILPLTDVPRIINRESSSSTVIFTKLTGGIKGVAVISASSKNMAQLAEIILHKPEGYFEKIGSENISAIKELADILIGYYITELNRALKADYRSSAPIMSINPVRSIEEFGFGPVYTEEIYVLILMASFYIPDKNIKKDILILFKKESLERLFEKLMMSEAEKHINK